ncbi:MAG TPA: MG2 domain-containing protein, partial [Candidatus Eisenbacteria bacterium]
KDGKPVMAAPPRDRALIRVTDLGLTGKTSVANHLFWLTSLSTGRPVAGASVEVRSASGRLVWSGTTGSDGLVTGNGLPLVEGEEWPLHAIATTADDQVWVTLGGDWNLEPWSFGLSGGSWNPNVDLDGMIYGDRDLYRPGETAHLKVIVRRRSLAGLESPGALAVRVEVDDPRGNPVVRQNATLSRFGTTHLDVPLTAAATPGTWSVRLVPPVTSPTVNWSVYGSFAVAEYKAPEFRVDLSSAKPWTLSGQVLPIDIGASYFFGAPLGGATARWSLSRRPFEFHPAGYDDYVFSDADVTPEYEWLAGRGEATLDKEGKGTLTPVADLGTTPVSLVYTAEVEVRDQTGRASAATLERPVHRGLAYPGIRVSETLVDAGASVSADIVLVAPDGAPAAGASGQVRLVRREWRTVRRLMVGGIVGSETTEADTLLERRTFPSGPGPHRMSFQVPTAGYYRLVVDATDGTKNRQQSAATFYASGPGDYAWGWEPGVQLELVADRKSYRPGDVARILVRSPFGGAAALVTLEREGLLRHETRRLDGTSEIVEVPIPAEGALPNLYVSVALVLGSQARKGADPRLIKPEFRLGMINLPVDHSGQALRVNLRPERTMVGPRDSVSIALELRDAAGRPVSGEMSVAVVDEAVLRLLGTQTPDPLAWFYRPRPLSVTTSEIRRQVVKTLSYLKAKGGDPGGGGGGGAMFRSLFATTALWTADVVTDANGRARVGVRLPDNLTTFRVMAVAVDEAARFGAADTTILVTKPLLVQAALPRFATTGDQFRGGAVVHNRTDRAALVTVNATADGLVLKGLPRPAAQSIPAGGSQRFEFDLAATRPGMARVRFSATGSGFSDGIETSFPVLDPVIARYDAATGAVESPVDEVMALPPTARPDSARVEVTLAPTILGGLEPSFRYLDDYPYSCVEQQASRAWARILEARLLDRGSPAVAAAEAVRTLAPYQVEDGGFVLYPGGSASQVGLTAWALLALDESRRAGGNTNALAGPAVRYLGWQLQAQSSDTSLVVMRAADWALALWAMSRWPREEPADAAFRQALTFLTEVRARLSADSRLSLALAWQGSGRDPAGQAGRLLAELENHVEQVADMAWLEDGRLHRPIECWEWWWRSPVRTNALYLSALLGREARHPFERKVTKKLLEERTSGRWVNTQANILSLAALAAYRDRYETDTPDLTAQLTLGGAAATAVAFHARTDPPVM